MARRGMHDHPLWFIYNDHIIILIEDVQRNVLRLNIDLFRLRDDDCQDLACAHLLTGFLINRIP